MEGVRITWRPREAPIAATAVAGVGEVARALARRLLEETDEVLARLRGVAGRDILVLLGEEAALPWADGVVYLGADPRTRVLLLPTALEPEQPAEIVDHALAARFPNAAPMAVLVGADTVVPVAAARPVSRAALARWLDGEG